MLESAGTTTIRVEREYIWGPGDGWGGGGAGVDELVAQFDRTGALTFALMDAGGDLVALCDAGESGGTARVVGQWVYDAYGNVISADHLYPHAFSHVGHKGLFIDRLDAGVADHGDDEDFEPGMFIGHASCEFDVPRVVPFAKHIYHNRNRTYLPNLGRFAQADPNASGMGNLSTQAYHGHTSGQGMIVHDLTERYRDSGSLFTYLRENPLSGSDPLGLCLNRDGFNPMTGEYEWIDALRDVGALANFATNVAGVGLGDFVRGVLTGMVAGYVDNFESDALWAEDWRASDEIYSRTSDGWVWTAAAFGLGEELGVFDALEAWDNLTGESEPSGPAVALGGGSGGGYRRMPGDGIPRGSGPIHRYTKRIGRLSGLRPPTFGELNSAIRRMKREFPDAKKGVGVSDRRATVIIAMGGDWIRRILEDNELEQSQLRVLTGILIGPKMAQRSRRLQLEVQ